MKCLVIKLGESVDREGFPVIPTSKKIEWAKGAAERGDSGADFPIRSINVSYGFDNNTYSTLPIIAGMDNQINVSVPTGLKFVYFESDEDDVVVESSGWKETGMVIYPSKKYIQFAFRKLDFGNLSDTDRANIEESVVVKNPISLGKLDIRPKS